jgi:hypothetical protein
LKFIMPRFVLLFHECPAETNRESHWDLMLESEGILRTWALAENPAQEFVAGEGIVAKQLPDHRLAYLDYEGPISNDRGSVSRVEAGQYELRSESAHEIVLELSSKLLHGLWRLSRTALAEPDHWLLSRILNSRAT